MSQPGADEPHVQVRQSLTDGAVGAAVQPSYSSIGGDAGPSTTQPSVNSTNESAAANGAASGGGWFRRRGADKAPLLQADLLRSLSGSVHTPGMESVGRSDGLSTFSGVACPVALSMFSVLLFLRMGFVVGQSGILLTIGQLLLAYTIIIFTVLSLCAISTNGAIEGGGVYYMISRALGPEFGGSIGVLFFLANAFSCALYISGFTEALINNFGPGGYLSSEAGLVKSGAVWQFAYGVLVAALLLVVCLVGAALFAKTSLVVLAIVAVCYLSFIFSLAIHNYTIPITLPEDNEYGRFKFYRDENGTEHHDRVNDSDTRNYTGIRLDTFLGNLLPNYTIDYSTFKEDGDNLPITFAIVFAVVFSGVTGIMAGANMSGELKRPNVSIPRGTVQAVLATLCIYVVTALLVGASCSRQLLLNDYIVMQNVNVWQPFILVAIFATTLFAALSNLIGASRVLVRLAEDNLFGVLLYPASIKFGKDDNPVFAVFMSWIIAVLVLLMGELNRIAQMTSIFFLLSYMGVNLTCLALDLASAPNFRPTFKLFSWHTALLGAAGSIAMMFFIDAVSSGIAIIFLLLLLMALHYKVLFANQQAPAASWGSISQALIFHQVRKYLLLLDSRKDHVKYWRPQMLLLVRSPRTSCPLIDFVNDLKKSGLYVIGHVRTGTLDDFPMDPLHEDYPYWLGLVDYLKVKAFVELTVTPTVRDGIQQLVRVSGLGAMKPNTVILGFHDGAAPVNTLESSRYAHNLKHAKLERAEVVEYFTARDLPPQHMLDEDGRNLSRLEYVRILNDILKLNKNLCLARHFHQLEKEPILRGVASAPRFVDVWPVDVVQPVDSGWGWDNSCLFLLQLACIISMVPGWKAHTTLRVFLCVTSMQDMQRRERQLTQMLGQLRITAKSLVLPWDHVVCHLRDADEQPADARRDAASLPAAYVDSLNEMLRRNSANTALVFINMPGPPPDETKYVPYIETLQKITEGLPPTLLVHGVSSVISTAL